MTDIVKIGFDIATKNLVDANNALGSLLTKAETLDAKLKVSGKKAGKSFSDGVEEGLSRTERKVQQVEITTANLGKGLTKSAATASASLQLMGGSADQITRLVAASNSQIKFSTRGWESLAQVISFAAKETNKYQMEVAMATSAGTQGIGKEIATLRQMNQLLEKGVSLKEAQYLMGLKAKGATDAEIAAVKALRREQELLRNSGKFSKFQAPQMPSPENKNVVTVGFKAKPFDDGYVASAKNAARANEMLGASFLSLGGIIGQVGFAFVAQRLVEMADGYALLQSRMKLFSNAGDDLAVVNQRLLSIANANRASLEDTGRLYVKLLQPLRELGSTSEEVLTVTDAFSKALFVGGANAREASAALIQFSQAMASGKLSGDRKICHPTK